MFGQIINLIYPASCQACGKKTSSCNQHLCEGCLKKIKKRVPPFCIKCGRQIPGGPELKERCNDCKNSNPYYDRALSAFHYGGILKKLVYSFKYKKITSLAKEFSDLIEAFMKDYTMGRDADLVLPIPMHPFRLMRREINPSHILARDLAKKLGIPYSDKILKKTKNTYPQSRLKRKQRIDNIKGSFSLNKNAVHSIRVKNILLVDDIFTTGSTMNECARVLKEAGSGYVEVMTLARGDALP